MWNRRKSKSDVFSNNCGTRGNQALMCFLITVGPTEIEIIKKTTGEAEGRAKEGETQESVLKDY